MVLLVVLDLVLVLGKPNSTPKKVTFPEIGIMKGGYFI